VWLFRSDVNSENKSPISRYIPRFGPISGEENLSELDAAVRETMQEAAEHAVGHKLPPLGDNPHSETKITPEICLFQPEWPKVREFVSEWGLLRKVRLVWIPEGIPP
jgi:hypothetical protein